MKKASLSTIKQMSLMILILTSVVCTFSLSSTVYAAVNVISMTPSSGNVGTSVELSANLTTENGQYEILFNTSLVAAGNATGYLLNASFTVPEISGGNHSVTVIDVAAGENSSKTFTVSMFYVLRVVVPDAPKQFQENDTVPIYLNMTGGDSSKACVANITLQNPSGASFVKMHDFQTSQAGTANVILNYPNDFPAGASTNIVGSYMVYFNDTLDLDTFSVGLTNYTEYHRNDAVEIRAAYKAAENVTITIAGGDSSTSVNVTADSSGIVNYSDWTVPVNASVGTYTVSIVSISAGPTVKNPSDRQSFKVPGFAANVTARNLAGDAVPSVELRAFEGGQSVANATTASAGLAILKLETGNYICEAYSKDQKVGELGLGITNTTAVDIVCNLTNLRIHAIAAVNGTEIDVPEAEIFIAPDNQMVSTDVTGIGVAQSLLPNVAYTVNVSRYDKIFNVTAIPELLVDGSLVPSYNVTVFLPVKKLEVTVFKANGSRFNDATVKIQERLGGIEYEGNTDANGTVAFEAVFGRYEAAVYDKSGIRLNETAVDLFEDQNQSIYCDLYGLVFSVKVVDFFGQPISGVTVAAQREGGQSFSIKTGGDGTATFDNVIGGNIHVAVYFADQAEPTAAQVFTVGSSTLTEMRIGKYTVLGGLLVETGQFAIVLIIVLTIIFFVSLEIYRMRRARIQKSES